MAPALGVIHVVTKKCRYMAFQRDEAAAQSLNGADHSNGVSHKHFEDVRPVLLARLDDHDRSASSICLVGSTDPEQLDGLSSLL
ncbi:hypothetical protein [Pseudomonas agarici]|uniref:hypothetical protein n=1 Tax=Pseudomonas agarici TaxID=46677 RepID=UPI000371B2AA|nr:hypothetical protein [Pseudomonas agarici]NWB93080.1 hypothetical protein [Pseudomonas agarici]NWC10133.1 hypothetical protein [Pseudomonas agarici]